MWTRLDRLALEVKYLAPAREFYAGTLDLPVARQTDGTLVVTAGDTAIELRTPGPVPRGGLHTHYALSIPRAEYGEWYDRLEREHDLSEHDFGGFTSMYCYDPDGHCVELGQRDVEGPGIDGVFEIVLEVESIDRALPIYEGLGGEVIDRGPNGRRVRLDCGAVDLELWEPRLGIADARGGVHLDLAAALPDPVAAVDRVADRVEEVARTEAGHLIRDPDGHYLTLREA